MGHQSCLLGPGRNDDSIFLCGCLVEQWILEVSRIQSVQCFKKVWKKMLLGSGREVSWGGQHVSLHSCFVIKL